MGKKFQPLSTLRVLNLGGGVQSSAMLVAALLGKLPRPDLAIFADTQWEPPSVIEHVQFLTDWAQAKDFEVCTVTVGSICNERGANQMPLSILKPDGSIAKMGRQCTTDYKIKPIRDEVRRRLGYTKGQRWKHQLETWLGITTDEAHRMKPPRDVWETVRWPLIQELNWNREDCKRYLERQGLPTPMKSSCIGCPYHSDKYYRDMKANRPKEWDAAVAFDDQLRAEFQFSGVEGLAYIHRKCIPLKEVYLQEDQPELGLGEECSGYCEA